MHTLRAPVNELLRKDKVWKWTMEYKMAFEKLKEVLTLELFLTHYNPDLDIIVASEVNLYIHSVLFILLDLNLSSSHRPLIKVLKLCIPLL